MARRRGEGSWWEDSAGQGAGSQGKIDGRWATRKGTARLACQRHRSVLRSRGTFDGANCSQSLRTRRSARSRLEAARWFCPRRVCSAVQCACRRAVDRRRACSVRESHRRERLGFSSRVSCRPRCPAVLVTRRRECRAHFPCHSSSPRLAVAVPYFLLCNHSMSASRDYLHLGALSAASASPSELVTSSPCAAPRRLVIWPAAAACSSSLEFFFM